MLTVIAVWTAPMHRGARRWPATAVALGGLAGIVAFVVYDSLARLLLLVGLIAASAAATLTALYVDNDAALLAGRELGGYPKKMAQITMRNYGDLFLSHMSRGSIQKKAADPNFSDVASSSVTKGGKLFSVPLAADTMAQLPSPYDQLLPRSPPTGEPQDYVLPTMALRRLPGVGPGADGAAGAEVIQLVGTPWHITKGEFYAADAASMELHPSQEDPIAQVLPFNSVLAAFILRGAMYTKSDEWMLIDDLKKKAT